METSTVASLVDRAQSGISAKRVFSEPIERDGTLVILAATVRGGAGGGEQPAKVGEGGAPAGTGTGFGLTARPAGAFIVQGGKVRWSPAVDVNRIILGAQIVALGGLLLARSIVRTRTHAMLHRERLALLPRMRRQRRLWGRWAGSRR